MHEQRSEEQECRSGSESEPSLRIEITAEAEWGFRLHENEED